MSRYLLIVALGVACIAAQPQASIAQDVTIELKAVVAEVDDPSGMLGGSPSVQDTIYGVYTFALNTPDSNPLGTVGDYWHTTAGYGIDLTASGRHFLTDPSDVLFLVEIVNNHGDPPRDNYLLRSYRNLAQPPLPSGAVIDHIAWQLDDPTALALDSEELPAVPPNLPDWQSLFGLTIEGCFWDPLAQNCRWDLPRSLVRAHVVWVSLESSSVDDVPAASFGLSSHPNPFAATNEIHYRLEHAENVRVSVFDPRGREVRLLANGVQPSGWISVQWDGRDNAGRNVPAGTYFARVTAGSRSQGCRLTLVR